MTDALEAQIEARSAEKAALAEAIERQAPVVRAIEGRLASVRRQVADAQSRVTALARERAAAGERVERKLGARSEGLQTARADVRAALALLGRTAYSDRASYGEAFAEARDQVARAEAAAARAGRAVRLHEAALASADSKKVAQGFWVAGGLALLLLLCLLFPALYRAVVVPASP